MTRDIETEPILQMGTDKMVPRNVYENSSQSDFLIEVNGKRGLNAIKRGD
jgi:hypothetical protein